MNLLLPKIALLGVLALGLISVSSGFAQEVKPATATEQLRADLLLPGASLADGISEITGVAISPLLGVSVIGAWTYFHTPWDLRHRLPWYCHPYAWGIGLTLIGLTFLKDFLGAAAPALVKKPLDFAELFEDKLSALVTSTAFVPLVALAMAQADRIQQSALSGTAMIPMAGIIDASAHTPWISIPVAVVAFVIVWLSSHAINVLIALSPFGIVDAGLKLTKLALITLVAGSAWLHPYAGAAVSLLLIGIAALTAGWSFRLTIFGTVMGRDFLLMKTAVKTDIENEGVKGFLARRTDGVPVRTFGKLVTAGPVGTTLFVYKPWLLLPARRLPIAQDGMVLCKGILHPSVAHRPDAAAKCRSSLILLPRYRKLEADIAARFGAQEVLDSALMRGFKAIRQWLVDILSVGRNVVEARA